MANNEKKRKMNPLLWFLFAIIIPVSVVIALVLVILNIAGFDTFNWLKEKGNNVPVVSNFITTEEEAELESEERQFQELMEEKDQKIEDLTQMTNDQEVMIQELEREILLLENNEESPDLTEAEDDEQAVDNIKPIAKSYEEMDPNRAALILQSMNDRAMSISILKAMSNDIRGEILQEMDPEIAADMTERLMVD